MNQNQSIWTEQKLAQPLSITMTVDSWCSVLANLQTLLAERSANDIATQIRNKERPVDREELRQQIEQIERNIMANQS